MTGEYPLFMIRGFRLFRARRPRSLVFLLGVAVVFIGAPAWPAAALEPGPTGAAAATQDGWWNRFQGPQEGEPEGNPLRPLLPAVPSPPTVPGDAIAAGAAGGQPDKVAAVGIEVALPSGGTVDALTLRLKEAPGNGANINSNMAKVLACPATTPWGPAKNAAWRDRPQADCALGQAEGTRDGDGTWTFDLTALGKLWTDPFAPIPQHGVVLSVDAAASPGVTQVSWLDFDSGNVVVELVASVTPEAPPFGTPTDSAPPSSFTEPPAPDPEVPFAAPPDEGFGSPFSDPLAFPSGDTVFAPTFPPASGTPATGANPAPTALVAAPGSQPQGQPYRLRPAVGFWENVPAPTALLLPVALGLALLTGLALGPGGRPLPVSPRAGGLSRALARRNPGGGGPVV